MGGVQPTIREEADASNNILNSKYNEIDYKLSCELFSFFTETVNKPVQTTVILNRECRTQLCTQVTQSTRRMVKHRFLHIKGNNQYLSIILLFTYARMSGFQSSLVQGILLLVSVFLPSLHGGISLLVLEFQGIFPMIPAFIVLALRKNK